MNFQQSQSPKSYYKTISIIHLALFSGQTLFALLVLYLNYTRQSNMSIVIDTNDTYLFVAIALVIGSLTASNILFKKNLDDANQQSDVSSKLTRYQAALIIRYALLEGASLFNIVVCMVTGNLFYLILSVAIILYFLSLRPTKDKIQEHLQLSFDETEAL